MRCCVVSLESHTSSAHICFSILCATDSTVFVAPQTIVHYAFGWSCEQKCFLGQCSWAVFKFFCFSWKGFWDLRNLRRFVKKQLLYLTVKRCFSITLNEHLLYSYNLSGADHFWQISCHIADAELFLCSYDPIWKTPKRSQSYSYCCPRCRNNRPLMIMAPKGCCNVPHENELSALITFHCCSNLWPVYSIWRRDIMQDSCLCKTLIYAD